MKVGSTTLHVFASVYEYDKTARVEYSPGPSDPVSRVIEFPKVWREGGKQYKVYSSTYYHNGGVYDKVTLRVPIGTICYGFHCDGTIEYY